jgi:fluoroacetyl-CoA thioesterase
MIMAQIPIGTKLEQKVLVDNQVAISFLGPEGARVLATPAMIGLMERTCRDAVLPFLDPGHDTVGTHVNVYHLAATPMGMVVTFIAEVTGVDKRRVQFKVEAWDERGKAGEGTHERAIINVARFTARMQSKSATQ